MEKADAAAAPAPFGISREKLSALAAAKSVEELGPLGGVEGLAKSLGVDLASGCATAEVAARRDAFGPNVLPSPPSSSLLELFIGALKDDTLILLMGCALLSIVAGSVVEEERHEHATSTAGLTGWPSGGR